MKGIFWTVIDLVLEEIRTEVHPLSNLLVVLGRCCQHYDVTLQCFGYLFTPMLFMLVASDHVYIFTPEAYLVSLSSVVYRCHKH